jgi:TolB-like protein
MAAERTGRMNHNQLGGWLVAPILLLLLSWSGPGLAQVEYQRVVVSASGVSREDAIEQALAEVARQTSGTSIEARQRSAVQSETLVGVEAMGRAVETFTLVEQFDSEVITTARGLVSSYRILGEWPTARGHDVEIEAQVPRYRVPGIDTSDRRRLAVIPFKSRISSSTEFFGPIRSDLLANELSQAILTQFVQSRRFAVLDRENSLALEREHQLLALPSTPISERAKLGQQLGTDYLVVGELVEAYGALFRRQGELTGMIREESVARVGIAYRILATATGEVRFADRVEIALGSAEGLHVESRLQALNEIARQLVGVALDRIYPIQVVGLSGPEEVILGQGGNTVAVGDQFRLVQRGAPLRDPYSGESLGFAETVVGTLEVTRTDGRVAYARSIGALDAPLAVGQVVRRDAVLAGARAPAVPPPSPRTTGVRLPFDR